MIKQKNNHARSKQKRRALRLKNRMKAIYEKRIAKRMKELAPKGKTVKLKSVEDRMSNYAVDFSVLFPNGGGGYLFDNNHYKYPNQRQKRKKWASNPHLRKAA